MATQASGPVIAPVTNFNFGGNVNTSGGGGAGGMAGNVNQVDAAVKNYNQTLDSNTEKTIKNTDAGKKQADGFRVVRSEAVMLSISLFVTGLVIRQITMSFVQLGKAMGMTEEETKEMTETVNNVNAAFNAVIGPMQIYIMWNMMAQMENAKLALSFMRVAAASMGAFLLVKAFTAEGKKARAVYAMMGSALIALSIAQWIYNAAVAAEITLKTFGAATPVVLAALALAGMVLTTGLVAYASGETAEGSYRTVERGGLVRVHKGEGLGRITPQQVTNNSGHRNITIISNDPYRSAKMIERYDRRGYGSKRAKRVVA